MLLAEVHRDGERTGYHYWNRFAGLDVDLTRDQFFAGEVVGEPQVVVRPPGAPRNYVEEFGVFKRRVLAALGEVDAG